MLSSLTSCIRSSISNGQANEDRFLACLSLLKKHFCIRLHQLVSKSFKIFSFPVEGLTLHHPFRSQPSNPLLTLPALSRNCAPLTLPSEIQSPKDSLFGGIKNPISQQWSLERFHISIFPTGVCHWQYHGLRYVQMFAFQKRNMSTEMTQIGSSILPMPGFRPGYQVRPS